MSLDENELLRSFEEDEWDSVPNLDAEIAKAKYAARSFSKKDKRINVRLSSNDLQRLQRIASQEGLPYQTLITSILHKYAAGYLGNNQSY
ncbi:MAG: hypothetical protein COC15_02300 [Legionellales bacterium]|nr:MAG: hypothetical protein COC15_02300 [Legionellales bacterium]